MSNTLRALWVVLPVFVLVGLIGVGAAVSRDCYLGDDINAFAFAAIAAVPVGGFFAYHFRETRKPLESVFLYVGRILIFAGVLGFMLGWYAINTLPRFTADASRSFETRFEQTSGWKNCAFGVRFDDASIHRAITVCGPRWRFPRDEDGGVILVTEQVGRYGTWIVGVNPVAHTAERNTTRPAAEMTAVRDSVRAAADRD